MGNVSEQICSVTVKGECSRAELYSVTVMECVTAELYNVTERGNVSTQLYSVTVKGECVRAELYSVTIKGECREQNCTELL